MTFATQETSRTLGAPIGLLLFTYGPNAGNCFGYTDAEDPVTYNNVTYMPIPTDRDSVTSQGSLDKAELQIHLPQDAGLSQIFDVWPPSYVVQVSIFQGHVGASDFSLAWAGRILSYKIQDNEAILTCEPISTSMRRSGLRRKYSYGCPHALYGADCGANRGAATIAVTVIGVSGALINLPSGWAPTDKQPKYLNGIASWTTPDGRTEQHQVLKNISATEIELDGYANGLSPGMTMSIAYGCSHQMGDCASLFNNINNFGGQPWIPYKNPFGITNNFY